MATQPVWTNDTPGGQPPAARYGQRMADEGNGKILMFGGRVGQSDVTETWEFTTATGGWRQLSPANSPAGREEFYMASEGNGKVLLFGGFATGKGAMNDTWEWNGTTWTQLIANGGSGSPSARDGGAMAALGGGQMLLFGGYKGGAGYSGDTWRWSGTAWTQVSTTGPSARYEEGMSNEGAIGASANGKILLFGGTNGNDFQDTWEWDNGAATPAWKQVATGGPPPRDSMVMALDKNGYVMLFGGLNFNANGGSGPYDMNDTWEWKGSGTGWVQKTPTTNPGARDGYGMAYDSVNARTVFFGGYDNDANAGNGAVYNDTWTWDGTSWTQISTAVPPNPNTRYGTAMADLGGGKVLLFGGYNGAFLNDTWTWNGSTWTQVATTGPAGRYFFTMAAEGNGKVLLFGGQGSGGLLGDTWEWNGTSWAQVSSSGPSARAGAAMASDGTGTVLLFGGNGAVGNEQSDTWEWNGSAWVAKSPATIPTHRAYHGMVSEGGGKVLMFGGEPGSGLLNDTWEWSGTNWVNKNPAANPTPRDEMGMAYDSARQRTVLFGGQISGAYVNDVWEFTGTTWVNLVPPSAPSVRVAMGMTYDASLGVVGKTILFGGQGTAITNDTWDYTGAAPTFGSFALGNSSPAISGNAVGFTASFSEAVMGVASTGFSFVTTGNVSGPAVTGVSTSGAVATVTASSGTGGGTLALKLTDDDTIRDLYGYPLGGPGTGATYTSPPYTIIGKPNAGNGSANVAHNTATGITLSATDTNSPAQALSYAYAQPAHGSITGTGPGVTYTPAAGYHGADSFTFTATNTGGATSSAATVSLTVAVGTPVAAAQSGLNVGHDSAQAITLGATDTETPATTLTYAIGTGPTHGTLGTLNTSTGAVTYTPATGFHGADSFTFTAGNGTNTSAAATVSLTVAVGTPSATAQSVGTPANTAQAITLAATDNDFPTLSLTYTVATSPAHGTLSGTAPSLTYTPNNNYAGSDSFTFTANNGTNTSAAATVSITVTGFAPSITSAAGVVFTDGKANTFTVTSTGAPSAALVENGALPQGVTFTDNGNGTATLSGAPAAGASGNYPLSLTANNGITPNATQSFTLALNRPPVAGAATLGTTQNTAAQVPVAKLLGYGGDPDGDPLTVSSVGGLSAQGGTVALSAPGNAGTITYTPANNFTGGDSLTYVLSDGRGGTATGTLTVTVTPANNHTLNVVSITKTAAMVTIVYAGIPGDTYQPQYSDSLDGDSWTNAGPVQTAGVGDGRFTYMDATQPQPAQRFYRAVASP